MHLTTEMLSLLSVLALATDADLHAEEKALSDLPRVELPALPPARAAVPDAADAPTTSPGDLHPTPLQDAWAASRIRLQTAADSVRTTLARLDAQRAAEQARVAAQLIANQAAAPAK